jgi:RNA polymerase sigma-70 factor (ECF subfamily)
MSDADEVLIERIRGGDADALAEYIDQRRPQLLAFIERNLSDAMRRKVEAEDLLQEVSVDCVRSLGDMDLSEREPFGWLCQVAERRIIDAHRKHFGTQKRDAAREVPLGTPGGVTGQAAVIDLLVASITSPSKAFSRDQKELRMLAAIDTLAQENQEAIRMRYVEGLPTKVIAERLGKSDAAVRVMLTRTIQKLQLLLVEDEE